MNPERKPKSRIIFNIEARDRSRKTGEQFENWMDLGRAAKDLINIMAQNTAFLTNPAVNRLLDDSLEAREKLRTELFPAPRLSLDDLLRGRLRFPGRII